MVLSCTAVHIIHTSAKICLSLGEVDAFYVVWSETRHLPFNVFYAVWSETLVLPFNIFYASKIVGVLLKMNFHIFCAF